MQTENADVAYKQQFTFKAVTQTHDLYTHLFVILHILFEVMGDNALQKC